MWKTKGRKILTDSAQTGVLPMDNIDRAVAAKEVGFMSNGRYEVKMVDMK